MADVEQLYRDYVAEHRAGGEADPRAYLAQLAGSDRDELEALIAGYLRRAPGREWDAEAYAGSPAENAATSIAARWDGWELAAEPRPWTELLPALRERAQIKRAELVGRLAEAIGFPAEAERVGAYYHQMEIGRLPSEGVSDRVLGALGELLGESAATLRAAGSAISAGEDREQVATMVAFARTAIRDPAYAAEADESGTLELASGPPVSSQAEDALDRLFTGGPAAG
jgi:hypothetical protein